MLLNCGIGEDSWESLGLQGDQTSPKGNQSWIFIGRTDAEAPILWPPDVKSWLIRKDPDAEKDWRQEEKGMTEDEMVRWYPVHDGHKFEQALEVGDRQGRLTCCSPWGQRVGFVKYNLCCNSASHRMRFYIWFSGVNSAAQEVRVLRAHNEAFSSFMWHLNWEFKSLSASFSFNILSSDI